MSNIFGKAFISSVCVGKYNKQGTKLTDTRAFKK